ncbi:PLP-dependent aminotransferase family protein [Aurantimonas sp. C2-6-R+9]|uniref:aminotransferase-like domain-containing protein n=1 Tax=unclassified Aurantimonas TaxID=2638230 RepID=UPI002E19A060|nr:MULTISPECIES: PLP-dependent aminotransferase family protein [unclassified Aurantimonas]MEC5293030.1 PLP-dependent aminotransferase family protein [Aurantimonas sp. C2-3-R2]MEC5383349.1 PLP-dependent aminotransferase family protein [Aurantimonas sp. C2-6-R+9]MEC5414042.1 PLP-dependent aminotransferase family protein [Aurantimonas sp. C2-4-R8]
MSTRDRGRLAGGTLVEQVMATVRQQIASRQTAPGARLPSIRGLAQRMQVSKSTVVDAYDRLAAEGVILSRRGSGFYVAGHLPPFSLSDTGPRLDREVDPIWMTRQSLDAGRSLLKPGCGWLPASWMPETDIRRALRLLAREGEASLTDYSTPHGLPALRQLLSRRLADRGVEAPPHQIMLTESGTQAIDLLCRFLVEPGDTVLLDDPCYFNFHAMLRVHRVKVVSVPYTHTGPDLELFEKALTEHSPRLYITNSALHNPTGATLSPVVAHRVLKLAEQHDLLIVEDDIFADFEQEPAPRLAAFDGLDRVIHIGSFSKTLSAAVRCGFVAARQDWIEELVDLKLATSFGGGSFSAELVLALLKDGAYRKHTGGLRTRLADAMGQVSARLKSLGLTPWIEPNAGMFLWCQLPEGLDAADVARSALAEGVVLAPGNAFSLSQAASGFLRFNVAQSLAPATFSVLERAMRRTARGP